MSTQRKPSITHEIMHSCHVKRHISPDFLPFLPLNVHSIEAFSQQLLRRIRVSFNLGNRRANATNGALSAALAGRRFARRIRRCAPVAQAKAPLQTAPEW